MTGKTGSGFRRKPDRTLDRTLHLGWFIGWAVKGNRRVILAEVLVDVTPNDSCGGPRSRDIFLKALPRIMKDPATASAIPSPVPVAAR